MAIRVLDIVEGATTADQGVKVFEVLKAALEKSDVVELSFDGVHTATSSFVNGCFVPILRNQGFQVFKHRVRVVKSNYQINEMIVRRLKRELDKPSLLSA